MLTQAILLTRASSSSSVPPENPELYDQCVYIDQISLQKYRVNLASHPMQFVNMMLCPTELGIFSQSVLKYSN